MDIVTKMLEMDQAKMSKYGWYSHCVPSGDGTPFGFNYHTHGLERSYKHKNIQVVLPIRFDIAHEIVASLIEEIKKGVVFEANKDYPDLMANGYMVRFIEATECGRPVLRLLVPDTQGKYEGKYAKQFEMLEHGEPDEQYD